MDEAAGGDKKKKSGSLMTIVAVAGLASIIAGRIVAPRAGPQPQSAASGG